MKHACIGEHLKHSFSKEIHKELADYDYEIKEIPREELQDFFENKEFSAINVTIPYKEAVIPYLYELDESAKKIGAVNTVVNRGGKLYGYNTDLYGMTELFRYAGIDPAGKKAAVLGTGGTAKTARAALTAMGASEIITVSRSKKTGCVDYEELYSAHKDVEIIVNATPVGMFPNIDPSPVSLDGFDKLCGVIDAVYNPLRTSLVAEARKKGIAASGGLYMLVAQAAKASEIFLDKKYPSDTLTKVYKKILAEKESIVLTGMPSSGKSTLGKALAKLLNRDFFDTDSMVEEKSGMKISDIFERFGENYFRNLEAGAILEASAKTGAVIATGGGAVLREQNVEALKKNGKLIFLDRELSELVPTDSRPLASDFEAIKQRYDERYPIYLATADMTVNVAGSPEELARKIKEMIYE